MSDVDGITCITDGYSDFGGEDDLEKSDQDLEEVEQSPCDKENEFIVNTLDDAAGAKAVRFNDEGGSYIG